MAYKGPINLKEINSCISDNIAFLCCASFEERSKTIALAVENTKVKKACIFYNHKQNFESTVSEISEHFSEHETIQMDFLNPIIVGDVFAKTIERIKNAEIKNIIIDVTTFTHETLLILLKILHSKKAHFEQICCLYTGAQSYGGASISPELKWLSKGCQDVRNVLGYPGILKPSAKTCLILLAGFELERATRLIEMVEPDRIAIGNGIEPTNSTHTDTMAYFRKKFDLWKKEYKNRHCENFEFSCKNVLSTAETIRQIVDSNPSDNYIMVPLNTKLSTIASALVSFQIPKIQLCYSIPEIYNKENYSTPDNKITVFNLSSIELFTL